jgi:hypothetical protein
VDRERERVAKLPAACLLRINKKSALVAAQLVVCIRGAASSLLARYLPTPAGIKGVYFATGLHLHRELCVDTRTHSAGLTS